MPRANEIIFRAGTGAPNPADVSVGEPCWSADGRLFIKRSSDGTVIFVGPFTLADLGAAASAHAHGNITSAGAIGSTSGQIVVTTTSGVLTVATLGSGLSLVGGVLSSTGGGGGSSSIGAYAASRIFR
jgi:hypothetical protein